MRVRNGLAVRKSDRMQGHPAYEIIFCWTEAWTLQTGRTVQCTLKSQEDSSTEERGRCILIRKCHLAIFPPPLIHLYSPDLLPARACVHLMKHNLWYLWQHSFRVSSSGGHFTSKQLCDCSIARNIPSRQKVPKRSGQQTSETSLFVGGLTLLTTK